MAAQEMALHPGATVVWTAALLVSARPEGGAGAVGSSPQHEAKKPDRSARPRRTRYGGTAATVATAAAAAGALGRVAGMIKKAVYRSSGRRVHGDDEKIPPSRLLLRICRSTYSGRGRHLPSTQYRARSAPPAPALRRGSACRTHLGRRIATGTRQIRVTRTRASVRPLAEQLAPRCQDSGPLKIR